MGPSLLRLIKKIKQNKTDRDTLSVVLDFIFPRVCFGCGGVGTYLCASCSNYAKRPKLKCFLCEKNNTLGLTCDCCRNRFSPDKIIAPFAYEGFIKRLLHSFKYEDSFDMAKPLSVPMTALIKNLKDFDNYSLTFVPLSSRRYKERGYNQSELLAINIAQELDMEAVDLLERIGNIETQVKSHSRSARLENIKGSIKLKKGLEVPKNIIIVDDVVTTGATTLESTKVLKKNGAVSVVVLAFAMGSG